METRSDKDGAPEADSGPGARSFPAQEMRALCESRLFRGASEEGVSACLTPHSQVALRKGDVLLEPGERHTAIYLLTAGRLGIYLDEELRIPVAHVEPGDCVGEIALIDEEAVCACVVALEPSRLLVTSAARLWQLMDAEPPVARNLMHVLAERVRRNNVSVLESFKHQSRPGNLTVIDPGTGLHNRRWMGEVFLRQIYRCARARLPVCLAMIDIDRFKSVNDTFGHQGGDRVLHQIARVMLKQFRPTDLIARHGGEEFAVLLPETGPQEAIAALERVRQAIEQTESAVAARTTVKVTVSVGIANWHSAWSLEDLVLRAEHALRRAKSAGRNRVALADDPA